MASDNVSNSQRRSTLRQARRSLSVAEQHNAARGIAGVCAQAKPVNSARRVGAYIAFDGELDLTTVMADLTERGTQVFVPVVVGDAMVFRAVDQSTPWQTNRFGIAEPITQPDTPELHAIDLDLILMPAVAVDRSGNRLGMGGGFYDRALAHTPRPVLVATVHDLQVVDQLTPMPHDIAVDAIATPTRWIDVQTLL